MDKSIRVNVLDRVYPLRVREDREERAKQIAAAVDNRMQSIRKQLPTEPDLTVAVMAALSYAEELETARSSGSAEKSKSKLEIESMVEALSAVVG
jgi:cell division protein ZapA